MFKQLRMPFLIGAVALILFPVASGAPPANICEVRIDNDGNCYADLADVSPAQVVIVTGVVQAWKHYGNRGPGAIIDLETGCCISVFDIDNAPDIPIGNLVRVEGWMGQFSGLDQITDDPSNGANDPIIIDLGAGNVPKCKVVQCADLQDGSPTAEGLESCLVSLCGNFVDGGGVFDTGNANYDFVGEDGNTCVVRIDSDTDIGGTPIPVGAVNICGVLGQFDGFGANLCGGYQILPRDLTDFTTATCDPVQTEMTTWGRLKSIRR